MRLAGEVAIITGAAHGIGRAAALRFAREGARVALIDIDECGGAVADEITEAGGTALFMPADITDEGSVAAAITRVVTSFSAVSILYNNAGGSRSDDRGVTETEAEAFWFPLRLDLMGTWLCCKYAIPAMIEGGRGSIINSASMLALKSLVGLHPPHAYSAAKGAIVALTRVMAVDYAGHGVRVNAVAPGVVLTDRIRERFAGQEPNAELERHHLLGFVEPESVADLALFLASREAAQITGQVFSVDSGYSIS